MPVLRAIVLLSAIPLVQATTGFTYNDDARCSYPLENFSIISVSCMSSSYLFIEGEGSDVDATRNENRGGDCYFGDQADMEGAVTLSEPVSRYFDVYLTICFKGNYYSKSCMKYHTSLDLIDHNYVDNGQQTENGNYIYQDAYAERTSKESDYLQAGSHSFKARFTMPKKSFTFKKDSIVSVSMTVYPKEHFLGANIDTYSYTSVRYHSAYAQCYATFSAIAENEAESKYGYYKASAISIAAAALATFGYMFARKRTITCTCLEADANTEKEESFDIADVERELSHYFENMDNSTCEEQTVSLDKRRRLRSRLMKFFHRRNRTGTSVVSERIETQAADPCENSIAI